MNKIFRVIWNQATQTWIAVSELAKGKVKASSNADTTLSTQEGLSAQRQTLLSKAVLAGVVTASFVQVAEAASAVGGNGQSNNRDVHIETNAEGRRNILIGEHAKLGVTKWHDNTEGRVSADQESNVVIGDGAASPGLHNIVIGKNARGWQGSPGASISQIIIGHDAVVAATRGIGIGKEVIVSAEDSLAIGNSAVTKGNGKRTIAFGTSTQILGRDHDSIAIGSGVTINGGDINRANSYAENTIAIGKSATITGSASGNAVSSVAIGHGATIAAGGFKGIALGASSHNQGENGISIGYNSRVNNFNAMALGANASTNSGEAIAVGTGASVLANTQSGIALGLSAKAGVDNGTVSNVIWH